MIKASQEASGDWKDLYRILFTSLRSSSAHFASGLSLEAATVGLWQLARTHANQDNEQQAAAAAAGSSRQQLDGSHTLGPDDRAVLTDWIFWADVLLRAFSGSSTTTPAALAASLGVPESAVLHFQPSAQPLLPAHALVVLAERRQLLLLIRGTNSLADVLTDIVAHTEPLGAGQAHSGMLDCARAILQQCTPLMQQHLQQHPGDRLHLLGHSLAGGVAAIATHLLRHDAALHAQVQAASGVVATGFGTPPVMTRELAETASAFTRTLVHRHDLVPRTCVASLALLRTELDAAAEQAYASAPLLSQIRESGALERGLQLAGAALAAKAAPGVSSPAAQAWVSAGIKVGAGLLFSKARQLHEEVLAGGGRSSSGSSQQRPVAVGGSNGNGNGSSSSSSGGSGALSGFAAMRQAAMSVGAAAGTPTAPQQQQQQHQQQQQQPAAQHERVEGQQQAAKVHLYCPGQIWFLTQASPGAGDADALDTGAAYSLTKAPPGWQHRFGEHIRVCRTMLSDHYLTTHMQALLQLQAQLTEAAAMQHGALSN